MKIYNNILFAITATLLAAPAFAQEAAEEAVKTATEGGSGLKYIAIGLMMGIAVFGGTFGQSRAATAALDGIARNPAAASKIQTPLILGLALMESLVLFAFATVFLIK